MIDNYKRAEENYRFEQASLMSERDELASALKVDDFLRGIVILIKPL